MLILDIIALPPPVPSPPIKNGLFLPAVVVVVVADVVLTNLLRFMPILPLC